KWRVTAAYLRTTRNRWRSGQRRNDRAISRGGEAQINVSTTTSTIRLAHEFLFITQRECNLPPVCQRPSGQAANPPQQPSCRLTTKCLREFLAEHSSELRARARCWPASRS